MAIRLVSCSGISCGGVFNEVRMTNVSIAYPTHKQQPKRASTTIIRSVNPNIKIFEDSSKGIVCYIDDGGDVICEGYDEGPRYSNPPARRVNHRSPYGCGALETFDLPQQPRRENMPSILGASESAWQYKTPEPNSHSIISRHNGKPTRLWKTGPDPPTQVSHQQQLKEDGFGCY